MSFEQEKKIGDSESKTEREQEFLRNELNRVAGIAGAILKIDQERKDYRLDPLFELDCSQQYFKDFIPTHPSEDQKITKENLRQIENQVLGLVFEVSEQILQPKSKKEGVRENPDSLRHVYTVLGRGEQLFADVQEKRPEDVQTILERILIEGRGISKEKINSEQIKQLVASIANARIKLQRLIKSLEGYFGR